MKVSYNPYINFGSLENQHSYKNIENSGNSTIFCTTRFFREDMNWQELAAFLGDFYQDENSINTIDLGCSDGSEAYSLAMLFDKNNLDKFYPIKAYDLNSELIFQAAKGRITITLEDFSNAAQNEIRLGKYFKNIMPLNYGSMVYMASDDLREKILFQPKEATSVLYDMDDNSKNTVLFFRNALPYLTPQNRERFYELLGQKLGEKSMVIFGSYDIRNLSDEIDYNLEKQGFSRSENFNKVYIKN